MSNTCLGRQGDQVLYAGMSYGSVPLLSSSTPRDRVQVHPGELEKFYSAYSALLRASMGTLRKRDKKREKQRAEEAVARKKKRDQTIVVDGPKRGAGRKKRQRKVKAAQRQEDARIRIAEREDKAAKAAKA